MIDVTVIITNYNYGKYLGRAIRSCINQTLRDKMRIVVVDDCSTDCSAQVLLSFWGLIDDVIWLPRNMGLGTALNIGLLRAISQYVMRLDADDYLDISCVETLWQYLYVHKSTKIWGVSVDYYVEDEAGKRVEHRSAVEHPIGCGIMFRTDKLIQVGSYDHRLRRGEDVDLRKRVIAAGGEIHNIPLPLYRYVQHKDNRKDDA